MYWICWSAQQPIISNYCHQTTEKTTGGRDLIKFKNTHSDKQSTGNKWAQRCPLSSSLPPSAIPGCLPAADNGCAPLRALYWDDGWGHLPHSRPMPMSAHHSSASMVIHTNGKKQPLEVSHYNCNYETQENEATKGLIVLLSLNKLHKATSSVYRAVAALGSPKMSMHKPWGDTRWNTEWAVA